MERYGEKRGKAMKGVNMRVNVKECRLHKTLIMMPPAESKNKNVKDKATIPRFLQNPEGRKGFRTLDFAGFILK